jgi:hypothetical protein
MQYVKDRLKPRKTHTYYTDSDVLGYVDCYRDLHDKPTDTELDLWDRLEVYLNTPIPYDHPRNYYIFINRVKKTPTNLKKVQRIFDLAISADEIIKNSEKYIPEIWWNPEAGSTVKALEDRNIGTFHKKRRTVSDQKLVKESFKLIKDKGLVVFEYLQGVTSIIDMEKSSPDEFYIKNIQVKNSIFGVKVENLIIKGVPQLNWFAKAYIPLSSSHKSNQAILDRLLRNKF